MLAAPQRLLTPAEMAAADRAAIAAGTSGYTLMQAAGTAVVHQIQARYARAPIAILCGPGNNGGDGYVIASQLAASGWPVTLFAMAPPMTDDAKQASVDFAGSVHPLANFRAADHALVVDAIFGAGLSRVVEPPLASVFNDLKTCETPVVAVDIPSGVDGATGAILGAAVKADLTVTFAAAKPGHYLLPGRTLAGALVVADIGIDDATLNRVAAPTFLNTIELWQAEWRPKQLDQHKYSHGHALILGGPATRSGAARLAAMACQRIGAGLTTLAVPRSAQLVYAAHLTTIMQRPCNDPSDLAALLTDQRFNALLIGPAFGTGDPAKDMVRALLASGRPCVLDADALTSFADDRAALMAAAHDRTVLTPHGGEFAQIFCKITADSKLEAARAAASLSGAIVLLKGADTVVAEPGGRAAIAANPTPRLAQAGTGDVLAGTITGLMARGMPAFAAACAAVWLNNQAANDAPRSFIAEDLPQMVADAAWELG